MAKPTAPTGLYCEGEANPKGVTDLTPEFSAVYNDPDVGAQSQKAVLQVKTDFADRSEVKGLWHMRPIGSGAELLTDPDLEAWTDDNNLTNWTKQVAGTGAITKESTEKHRGAYSAKLEKGDQSSVHIYQQHVLTSGNAYIAEAWVKGSGTARVIIYDVDSVAYLGKQDIVASGSWQKITVIFNAIDSIHSTRMIVQCFGTLQYFDDCTLKECILPDSSGNTNNGTPKGFDDNEDAVVDGKFGKCIDFDGVDDCVQVVASDDFDFKDVSAKPFKISAWVKPHTSPGGGQTILSVGTADKDALNFALDKDEKLYIVASTGGVGWDINNKSTDAITLNVWSLVEFTRDTSGNYKFYINGEDAGGGFTNSDDILLDENSVKIGGHYSLVAGWQFDGLIDEVCVVGRALSAAEIRSYYKADKEHNADMNGFSDDFEDGNLDKWTSAGTAMEDWAIATDQKHLGAYSAKGVATAGGYRYFYKTLPNSITRAVQHFWARMGTTNKHIYLCFNDEEYFLDAANDGHFKYHDGAFHNFPNDKTYVADTWYEIRIEFDSANNKYKVWVDTDYLGEVTTIAFDAISEVRIKIETVGGTAWIDDLSILPLYDISTVDKGERCEDISYIGQVLSKNSQGYAERMKFIDTDGNLGDVSTELAYFVMLWEGLSVTKSLGYSVRKEIPVAKDLKYTIPTTPSAKTKSLKYDIFLGSTKTEKGLIYKVVPNVKIEKGLIYKALPAIAVQKSLKYTIPTTPSAKTKSLKYDIFLGSTKIEKSLKYDIFLGATKVEKGLIYDVKAEVKVEKALKYTIITIPAKTEKGLGYYVLKVLSKTKGLIYKAVPSIKIEKGLIYKVLPTISINKSLKYTVITTPAKIEKSLRYDVFLGSTKIEKGLAYYVIVVHQPTKSLKYTALAGVKIEKSLKYTILTTPAKREKQLKYNILLGIIKIEKGLIYDVKKAVKIEKGLIYSVLPAVNITKSLKYCIPTTPSVKTKELKYNIFLGTTKVEKELIYRVVPSIKVEKGLIYDVISPVKIQRALKYTIFTIPAAKTKDLKYNIFLGTTKIEKGLIYDVLTSTKIEKGLIYMALPVISINKTLKYTTISTPAKVEKQLRYDVFLGTFSKTKELGYYALLISVIQKSLKYVVLTDTKIEKILQYACQPVTQIWKSLKYTILATPEKKTKSLRYDIFLGATAIQKALKYCCLTTPTKIEKSLRYDIFLGATAIQKGLIYKALVEYYLPLSLKYTVLPAATAIQKDLKYTAITTPTATTKGLIYSILTVPAGITKALRYAILTITKIEKALRYTAVPTIAITKDLKYTVITAPSAIEKSLKYTTIITPAGLTKSLKYCVIATPEKITKGLIYGVLTEIGITKGLHYEVLSEQAITKGLKYCVITVLPIQKSLEYQIITTPAGIDKYLRYAIVTQSSIVKSLKYCVISQPSAIITKELKWIVRSYPYVPYPQTYETWKL